MGERPERCRPAPLLLCCPACAAEPLGPTASGEGAAYVCPACRRSYAMEQGILDLRCAGGGRAGYDPHYFNTLPLVEGVHFWFVARRERILQALRRSVPDLGARSLVDVGCGSGGLAAWLERSGLCVGGGCDAYPQGLAVARGRLQAPLVLVDLEGTPPLAHGQSMLGYFDVLEHLDDDAATLSWAYSMLTPGGVLVLTVPAHPFLFDEMDEIAHHRRRYRRSELASKLRESGFEIRHLAHFMALLVPLLVAGRALGRLLPKRSFSPARRRDAELAVVPGVNAALLLALRVENFVGRWVRWPFGTSLVAVAVRPDAGARKEQAPPRL